MYWVLVLGAAAAMPWVRCMNTTNGSPPDRHLEGTPREKLCPCLTVSFLQVISWRGTLQAPARNGVLYLILKVLRRIVRETRKEKPKPMTYDPPVPWSPSGPDEQPSTLPKDSQGQAINEDRRERKAREAEFEAKHGRKMSKKDRK